VSIEGTAESPVVVDATVSTKAPGGQLVARHAVFAGAVMLGELGTLAIGHASFTGGLSLRTRPSSAPATWRLERCEFFPTAHGGATCVELSHAVKSDALALTIAQSNFQGALTGTIGPGAQLDASRNHWELSLNEATGELTRRGRLIVEPIAPGRIDGAGACSESALSELLTPLGKRLVAKVRERLLTNSALRFEVEYPSGWRTAGDVILVAPSRYARARVQFKWHPRETLPVRLRTRVVSELGSSRGVSNVTATPGKVVRVGRAEGLDFTCTFVASGARWAQRVVVVPHSDGSHSITLRAKEGDLPALDAPFKSILSTFARLGN
jgi:hypothetical protein